MNHLDAARFRSMRTDRNELQAEGSLGERHDTVVANGVKQWNPKADRSVLEYQCMGVENESPFVLYHEELGYERPWLRCWI